MATYYARKNGNVNAADVWATTPTGTAADVFSSFTNADTLVLNAFTISVTVSFTVGEVRADTTGGATAGGVLNIGGTPVTITANINASGSSTNGTIQTVTNPTFTIIGNITAGIGNCVRVMGAAGGNVTVVGNVTGGTSVGASGLFIDAISGCTLNITGNITGGTGVGVNLSAAGNTVNVTGNVTGAANNGIALSGNTTLNITGTVTGGAVAGVAVSGTASILNVTGTCVGGTAAGVTASSAGSVTATRARGGPLSSSAVGISNGTAGSIVTVDELEYGDLGASPTSGPIRMADKTSNVVVFYRPSTTKKTLVDTASTSLLPAASNVRSGTVYNAGQTTGTCAVPPAGSVLLGVPVDNTTGTAAVSSAAVQSAFDAALAAFSSGRLANVATVSSTAQQIATIVSP